MVISLILLDIFTCFTAFAADTQIDLPALELPDGAKVHMIYQKGAAFLHADSPYDYLATRELWPCAGLVFSHKTDHLMIHKDSGTDVASVIELLHAMKVSKENMGDVKVTIFSRKMREEIYRQRGFFEEYKGLSQEEELQRTKSVLLAFAIPAENIRVIISNDLDNTLIVDKQGQVFRACEFNKNFYTVKGTEILTRTRAVPVTELPKRKEIASYYADETRKRMGQAYKEEIAASNGVFNINTLRKPYLHAAEAPQGWPCYKQKICSITNCHRLAESLCSRCKKASYCSRECQTADWPNHKLGCKQ